MTLELHLTPEIQDVTELEVTERGAGKFGSTASRAFKVIPSPGKPHSPSRPEGAHILGFSHTNLMPSAPEKCLLLRTNISSLLAAYSAKPEKVASSTDFDSAVSQALGLVSSLVQGLVSAFPNRLKVPSSADSANGGALSGLEDYPPVPVQKGPALIPVQQLGSRIGSGIDQGCPWLTASTENAQLTGTGPELARDEATSCTLTRLDIEDSRATRPNPMPSPSG